MKTEERMELGAKLKHEMNCCQAVVSAFADTVDVDGATLRRIAGGFGSGMGTTEGTCGALVGAVMVTSLRAPAGGAMALSRSVLPRFKELCGGATICRELKASARARSSARAKTAFGTPSKRPRKHWETSKAQ